MIEAVKSIRNVVIFHKDHAVSRQAPNGGAETATLLLAHSIAAQGYRVVLCASFADTLPSTSTDKIEYLDLGSAYDTQKAFQDLQTLFNGEQYILIVASRAQALLESRYNSQVALRVFLSHEPSANGFGIAPSIIGEVADLVICISEAQKQLLAEAGCQSEKIRIVPNGVDLVKFTPGEPASRNYNRLTFVGALVIDKGLHLVIDAFAQLRARKPELTLDIYGSASLWGRADYLNIEELKKIPGITFHGAITQSELAAVYREAGLLIIPSIYFDAFNLVAAEAQSCGLPAIGSIHGGMKEIILDGITGKLVEPTSGEALARDIASLLQEPGQLRKMSEQALDKIRGKFDWNITAKMILAAANNCLEVSQSPTTISTTTDELRVGLLSTFNQDCGLATYANYFREGLSAAISRQAEVTAPIEVLAENLDSYQRIGVDDEHTVRCWTRGSDSFIELDDAIQSRAINVLVINCHSRFFGDSFPAFLNSLRARGISVVTIIHSIFTMDIPLQRLLSASDLIITHTPETRLEALANGASPEKTLVIPHGVITPKTSRADAREALGIDSQEEMIVCAGFIQPHKGIDEVIAGLAQIRHKHPRAKLYVIGKAHREDPNSVAYKSALQQLVVQGQLRDQVQFIDGFHSDEVLERYLSAADLVVYNYRSQYFESSGAVALALGCGAPVVVSCAPTFQNYGSAVFHATNGFPLPLAMDVVLSDCALADELRVQARAYAKVNSWKAVGQKFAEAFRMSRKGCTEEKRGNVMATISRFSATRPMRILMLNRPNALTQRGGDTVVMENVAEGLRALGVSVDIDITGSKNPKEYDLVHLHNFATPEYTEQLARRVHAAGIPFVVTTMYEDLPQFYNQMIVQAQTLTAYVNDGQPAARWAEYARAMSNVTPSPRFENGWVARNANALIASGEQERQTLLRDYPDARQVNTYVLGSEADSTDQPAELFTRETGLKDFVLCVGRLETRKNQLMLLKALEDCSLDLVFVCGDFSYQPEYEAACRAFKRAGRTIFLGRLSAQMLSSAYAAAKVHALPSWYELPGIVSIEAARRGKNVVACDNGTARDYLGNDAFYCSPNDPESILNAVLRAYHSSPRTELATRIAECTWARAAQGVLDVYQTVMNTPAQEPKRSAYQLPEWDVPLDTNARIEQSLQSAATQAQEATATVATLAESVPVAAPVINADVETAEALCDDGDEAIRSGNHDEAERCYQAAAAESPKLSRPIRSLGVLELVKQNWKGAETHFRNALRIDIDDARALAGMASCLWNQGSKERAFDIYKAAFDRRSTDSTILLHLMNAAYGLGKHEDLERCIRVYLEHKPDDLDFQYCLAGCCYKQRKLTVAAEIVEKILTVQPDNANALELRDELDKAKLTRGPLADSPVQQSPEVIIRELETAKQNKNWEAIVELAPAVIDNPGTSKEQRAYAQTLRGDALAFCGEYALADASYIAASESLLQRGRALTGRGVVALSQGKLDDAERFFRDAIAADAKSDASFAGLGVVETQRQHYNEAWDYFQKALAINGENQRALLGAIQVGYPLNRLSELENTLRAYLELHPANIDYLYALAGCLYAQKRFREARSEIDKIRLFDPMNNRAMELEGKIIGQMQAMSAA